MGLALGVIALIVIGALLRSALAVGAAYALTALVSLPSLVDVLAWVAAGGFIALQVLSVVIALAAIGSAGKTTRWFR